MTDKLYITSGSIWLGGDRIAKLEDNLAPHLWNEVKRKLQDLDRYESMVTDLLELNCPSNDDDWDAHI